MDDFCQSHTIREFGAISKFYGNDEFALYVIFQQSLMAVQKIEFRNEFAIIVNQLQVLTWEF